MRVLRIEVDGLGVFKTDVVEDSVRAVVRARGEPWPELESYDGPLSPFRHPCPDQDVPAWAAIVRESASAARRYFCAFDSQDQLLRWFDSEAVRVEMNKRGADLIEYEVDETKVLRGDAQCMFLKDEAHIVSTGRLPTVA